MFDVITIGSATRDVLLMSDAFVAIESKKIKGGRGECVALGSKIDLDDVVLTTGGGATNAAATFGSLGFQVATITKIGDDSPGKDVVDDLSRYGVSTKHVRLVKGGRTAYSTLLTMKDGERTVLVYRGVSKSFTHKDIDWNGIKNTKWIYLTSLGGDFALSKKIIEHAHKAGVKVMWNPGSGELSAGLKSIAPLLTHINILNLNKEEAIMLTGKKSMKEMFKALRADGTIRLITDGANGTHACCDTWIVMAATTGAKAISRTGAGDAFGSGFLAGLLKRTPTLPSADKGWSASQGDISYALAVGTINAESVIQKQGPKLGILSTWPGLLKVNRIKISH